MPAQHSMPTLASSALVPLPQHPSNPSNQSQTKSIKTESNLAPCSMYDEDFQDAPINQGLLNHKRKSIRDSLHVYFDTEASRMEWMRPYWLGASLGLLLFAFWILDSLKDPLFARLVDGKIEKHQPTAKLCSVASTLLLVCIMEYLANQRQAYQQKKQQNRHQELSKDQVLEAGGVWNAAIMYAQEYQHHQRKRKAMDDSISTVIFYQIGIPYGVAFIAIAYFVQQFEAAEYGREEGVDMWYVLAYVIHATVESFGSIAVATFWSYANSTLALDDAERYYGPIVALAQLGAIGGSSLVASGMWQVPSLLLVVSLVIILQLIVMTVYSRRFQPTSVLARTSDKNDVGDDQSILTWQDNDATLTKPFWSGIYLIFHHNYVLLILGASCLYEIALTCLDYQMKLLGYAHFATNQGSDGTTLDDTSPTSLMATMSFAEFMGRYGQAVNFISLVFSSLLFPFLIRRYGLRVTLRLFPTLLLVVTIVAYGAMPGNLTVLFVSLSLLKAMTYSVHDPSKELLYIPTSNAVKFRAKFWIDVVGERISKAMGGVLNKFSGSVEKSIRVGSLPSLVSAAGLWFVCYYVGIEFDRLLRTGTIVGLEESVDPATYRPVPKREEDVVVNDGNDDDENANENDDTNMHGRFEPSEIHLNDDQSLSTLGLDTSHEGEDSLLMEVPAIVVRI